MPQVDYVSTYLTENFETIQKARQLPGFSWKPIVEEIVALFPQSKLDPTYSVHRDRVRNNFLHLRKRKKAEKPLEASVTKITPAQLLSAHRTPIEIPKYEYIDTYNKKSFTPIPGEDPEFTEWKLEKHKAKRQEGMHIVIGCMHLPAVNKPFFEAFLKFLNDARDVLKGIHLIGDIIDCKSLSQHDNGQVSDITLDQEYKESNIYLDRIDALLRPGVEKNYIWGNHEQRYERIIKKVDISKFGRALLSPTEGCRFAQRGYTIQEDYQNGKIQLGKHLDLVHGQYITQNSAKKHLDVYKKSIMFAHTHKMGAHFDGDKASFNIGWMGDKDNSAFSYSSRITKSQWQNGFAVVNIDSDGVYHTQLVQWYNDKFVFGTMIYDGK